MLKLSAVILVILRCQVTIVLGVPSSKQELVAREERTIKQVIISRVDDEKDFQRIECPYPYVNVAEKCLYAICDIASDVYTWSAARSFCNEVKLGDLATFETACELDDIASYLRSIPSVSPGCNYWVGGLDSSSPAIGNWTWINGEPMPNGAPFWSNSGSAVGPTTSTTLLYAQIQPTANYRLVNVADGNVFGYAPLCEYNPPKIDVKNSVKTIPSYYYVPYSNK